jgi:hypothetical protein
VDMFCSPGRTPRNEEPWRRVGNAV